MLFGKSKPKADEAQPGSAEKPARFARLGNALKRTRAVLNTDVRDLLARRKVVSEDLLEEIETVLLSADVGVAPTQRIIGDLSARLARNQLDDSDAVLTGLRENMLAILEPVDVRLDIPAGRRLPYVVLMVGVNGTGKTTTIGKLARRFRAEGRSVMLAAGDTFRAAAVEQLQAWGERNDVPVVAQHTGADSASVVFDALRSAQARGVDVLIADTAGRLHTQGNLMEELKKVRRVLAKIDPDAPHEVMLVLDAGTGQNALAQAVQFHAAVEVSGITLTKLDGTAKGGIVFAIAERLGLPVRFIGVGEGVEDLREFNATEFVDALLSS